MDLRAAGVRPDQRPGAGSHQVEVERAIAIVVAWALGAIAIVVTAEEVAARVARGAWPQVDGAAGAIRIVAAAATHSRAPQMAWPPSSRAEAPGTILYWAVLVITAGLLLVGALLAATWAARLRYGRPGFAAFWVVRRKASAAAARRTARVLRPSLSGRRVAVEDVGVYMGEDLRWGRPIWATREDSILMTAPPRKGKSLRCLVPMLRRLRGPQIIVSSRDDLLRHTAFLAEFEGRPLWVLDFMGVVGLDGGRRRPHAVDRAVWNATGPAAVPRTARLLADAIVGVGFNPQAVTDGHVWQEQAQQLIACVLHAAALDGRDMRWLHRVIAGEDLRSVADILRRSDGAAPGWAQTVDAVDRLPAETRGGVLFGATAALACLNDPELLDVCCPAGGRPEIDVDRFFGDEGRIFVLASSEQQRSLAGLVTAFAEWLIGTAKERAARTATGRLDPPLAVVVDEMADVCPLRSAGSLVATGGGRGITPVFVFQSLGQMRAAYGEAAAGAILGACTVKIFLGGLSDVRDLETVSRLMPDVRRGAQSRALSTMGRTDQVGPALSPAEVREIRTGQGLLLFREQRPMALRLRGHWESRVDGRAVRRAVAAYDAAVARRSVDAGADAAGAA